MRKKVICPLEFFYKFSKLSAGKIGVTDIHIEFPVQHIVKVTLGF